MIYYAIIVLVAAIDQGIKYLVDSTMYTGQSIPVAGDILQLTYVRNTGAAFSVLQSHTWLLTVIGSLLIIAGIIYVTRHRYDDRKLLMWALSVIIGGGLGNVIDRIVHGYVTDYLDLGSWPVFNFADICVSCGCVLLCIYVIFIEGRDHGKRQRISNRSR